MVPIQNPPHGSARPSFDRVTGFGLENRERRFAGDQQNTGVDPACG
jgi:hypothetical protein